MLSMTRSMGVAGERDAYINDMAGQMTVDDDYGHKPYSCLFLGKPLEQMSREELIGACKFLGEQCNREREDALAVIKAMHAFSLRV